MFGIVSTGCKKAPDEALVVFQVVVDRNVMALARIEFSVKAPPSGVPPKPGPPSAAPGDSFQFGYYMPGVNGDVTIVGLALDSMRCVVGQGMLPVTGVTAGKRTASDTPLTIVAVARSCSDGGTDGGSGGRDGSADAPDTGSSDADAGDAGTGNDGPKAGVGATCRSGDECASTFCVDGVCCQSACSGSCEACAEMDMKGTCMAVTGAPRPSHPACAGAGTPCAGTCDGASRTVCSYPGTSQSCRAASCTGSTATLAAACDGKGACPAAQTVDCTPNACAGTICAGGCSDTQPCPTTQYCAAGRCVAKKPNGQACLAAAECANGFCADGVCCNSACATPCMACNLAGSSGTCSAVRSAIDDACSGMQSCDATGACKKANGQTCTAAADCTSGACVDGRCCAVSACSNCQACTGGGGMCVAVTGAEDDSCSGSRACDAMGICKTKAGQACTAGTQCATGFCADGVCCDAACTGACESCGETSTRGTCVAVTGAPRTGHAACAGAGSACGGACDGNNRTACSYPGAGQSCRAASCTNGVATLAASCDGQGGCPAVQTMSCSPNTCSGTACAGGCSATQPCSGNNYCSAGTCVPKKGNGATCAAGGECTSNNCVDGVCCASASCGTCQACTAPGGTCAAVTNVEDPNSCSNTSRCDGSGSCKKKNGQTCVMSAECVSGSCVDGVCCESGCSGTCQYCNSAGACVITPQGPPRPGHGSCPGAGACQGSCNGVSASCSMPGTNTVCRQPSCSSATQAINQAFCDGQGNCPAQTTSNCSPFVCSANACLTSCSGTGTNQCVSGAACIGGICQTCQSGLTACGNVCADLTRDNNRCGSCTTACSGGTPYCVNRSCVQCRAVADCPNGYMACANNSCACRLKSSGNLLTNGGLDGSAGWMFSAPSAYANTIDADNCPGSGSVASGGLGYFESPCASVTPNTSYLFGLRARGQLVCWLDYYTSSACAGTDSGGSEPLILGTDGGTIWENVSGAGTTDADTRGVRVHCSNPLGGGHFDQFYLTTGGGSF